MLQLKTKKQAEAFLHFNAERILSAKKAITNAILNQPNGWRQVIRDNLPTFTAAAADLDAFTPQFVARFPDHNVLEALGALHDTVSDLLDTNVISPTGALDADMRAARSAIASA